MAATYDLTDGGTTQLQELRNTIGIWSKKINLNDLVVEAGLTISVADDVFEVLNIPAQSIVLFGGVNPVTAEGDTLTISLGDGGSAAGYMAALDLEATTPAATVNDDGYGTDVSTGRYYASADTLDIKVLTIGAQTTHLSEFIVWAAVVQVPTS